MTHRADLLLSSLQQQLARLEDLCAAPAADVMVTPRVVAEKARAARALTDALAEELRRADIHIVRSMVLGEGVPA